MVAAKWHTGRKALSLNLNFSFPNRISLLLTSSSYPIVLRRLGGPRSRPFTSRKMSRVKPGIEPGTSWMAVRRANYYINQAPRPRIEIKILHTTGNWTRVAGLESRDYTDHSTDEGIPMVYVSEEPARKGWKPLFQTMCTLELLLLNSLRDST